MSLMSPQMCTHSFRSRAEPSSGSRSGSPVGDRLMMPSRAPLSSSSCSTWCATLCGTHGTPEAPCAPSCPVPQVRTVLRVGDRHAHPARTARLRHGAHAHVHAHAHTCVVHAHACHVCVLLRKVFHRGIALRHRGKMRHAHGTQASEERAGGGGGPEQARRKADGKWRGRGDHEAEDEEHAQHARANRARP